MIELTELEALGYMGSILSAGVAVGYTVGYQIAIAKAKSKPTITTTKQICKLTIDGKSRNVGIERIFVNGKQSDVSCSFLMKDQCELTSQKCKHF